MMNFNTIKKYSNFLSYQRIKAIKVKQKFDNKDPKPNGIQKESHTYQDYLDKKDGFKCCCVKTCNGCCDYAPIPSIPNSALQSYSTTSREECICFKGMLEVGQDVSGIGYSNGSFGSLSPNKTCEDLTIAKLYADNTNTVHLILKGDTFGETIWKCLILTQGNTTIRLRKILSTITNDTEYSWDNIKAVEKFNVGKQWCIQLTQ